MAKIGGRNAFIAVPIGLICAAIVGALLWLAAPMTPVVVAWAGDMLRSATAPPPVTAAVASPAERAAEPGDFDCRALYPDSLWSEMTWHGSTALQQTRAAPTTEATALVDVLTPKVRVSCAWNLDDGAGGVVTTLASVAADAVPLADASLRGQGFSCTAADQALQCTRVQGDVLEEHTFRDGWWLSSVETTWHPEDYGARLDAFVWG